MMEYAAMATGNAFVFAVEAVTELNNYYVTSCEEFGVVEYSFVDNPESEENYENYEYTVYSCAHDLQVKASLTHKPARYDDGLYGVAAS